jgi:four helix bundle protein
MYHSFEDLDVWKRACQLAVRIYELLRDCRDFNLRDQMQRAAVSIPSNIAEGSERGGRDFMRYLKVAKGSAAELRTQCYIACRIGTLDRATTTDLVNELKAISRMLSGLAKAIESRPTENRKLKTEN